MHYSLLRRFRSDLMDPEDLEDLDCERADRSGHSFDGYQQNPYYSKITTAIPEPDKA